MRMCNRNIRERVRGCYIRVRVVSRTRIKKSRDRYRPSLSRMTSSKLKVAFEGNNKKKKRVTETERRKKKQTDAIK